MQNHLLTLTQYNHWANERVSKLILEAGEEKSDLFIASSFPSIRKTLFHIWDAQVIWLLRLEGKSLNTWPSHSFTGNLSEALNGFKENSLEFVRFFEKELENDSQRLIEYHSTDGTAFHNSVEEILMHVMNHSTFHRGQIISMLRIAGFDKVVSTDMIRFFRERNIS
jgi:uncharacterized damage-inducible protein DinB